MPPHGRSALPPWSRATHRWGLPQLASPPRPSLLGALCRRLAPRAASAPATARPEPAVPAAAPGLAAGLFSGLEGSWRLRCRIDSALASEPSGTVHGSAVFQPLPLPRPAGPPRPLGNAAAAAAADAAADYHYREQGVFQTDTGGRFRVRREYVYGYSPADDRIDVFFAAAAGARDYLFHSLRFAGGGGEDDADGDGSAGEGQDTDGGSGSGSGSGAAAGSNGTAEEAGQPPAAPGCSSPAPQSQSSDDAGGVASSSSPPPPPPSSSVVAAAAAAMQRRQKGRWWCRAVGDHRCDLDMHYVSYRFRFRGAILEEFEVSYKVRGPQIDYVATAVYSREPGAAAAAD